jgi:hypothetical protein
MTREGYLRTTDDDLRGLSWATTEKIMLATGSAVLGIGGGRAVLTGENVHLLTAPALVGFSMLVFAALRFRARVLRILAKTKNEEHRRGTVPPMSAGGAYRTNPRSIGAAAPKASWWRRVRAFTVSTNRYVGTILIDSLMAMGLCLLAQLAVTIAVAIWHGSHGPVRAPAIGDVAHVTCVSCSSDGEVIVHEGPCR